MPYDSFGYPLIFMTIPKPKKPMTINRAWIKPRIVMVRDIIEMINGYFNKLPIFSCFRSLPLSAHMRSLPFGAGRT